jgi:hypothetical protein
MTKKELIKISEEVSENIDKQLGLFSEVYYKKNKDKRKEMLILRDEMYRKARILEEHGVFK